MALTFYFATETAAACRAVADDADTDDLAGDRAPNDMLAGPRQSPESLTLVLEDQPMMKKRSQGASKPHVRSKAVWGARSTTAGGGVKR